MNPAQRVLVRTYGCQMNAHDSEKLTNLLLHCGWTRAAGLDESQGIRVWTVIREVPDGNWGAAGQQVRYAQLVEAAAAEREKTAAPA